MKMPFNEIDKEFDNSYSGIYVVIDSTTNLTVVPPFTMINDCAAVGGFVVFLKEEKEKKKPFSKYVLRNIGIYDNINHKIMSALEYDIISDDEDYESYFSEICEKLKKEE